MAGAPTISRRVLITVVVIVLQGVIAVSLLLAGPADQPRHAPVRLVAPAVVAAPLIESVDALSGSPVTVTTAVSEQAARDSVSRRASVAAIVVDLAQEQDRLYVSSGNGRELNAAVTGLVSASEATYGRTVDVVDVSPSPVPRSDRRTVYVLVGAGVLLGIASAVVVTWRRGPMEHHVSGALVRLGAVAVASGLLALPLALTAVVAVEGGLAVWWLLLALLIGATTGATFALESLLGAAGIGVAATAFVLTASPLVRLVDPLVLPSVWSSVTPFLPHGAALDAATRLAFFGGHGTLRPGAVLMAWVALSLLVVATSRREIRRTREDMGRSSRSPASASAPGSVSAQRSR